MLDGIEIWLDGGHPVFDRVKAKAEVFDSCGKGVEVMSDWTDSIGDGVEVMIDWFESELGWQETRWKRVEAMFIRFRLRNGT